MKGASYQWNEKGLNQKTKGIEERMRSESNTAADNKEIWEAEKQRIRQENAGVRKGIIAQEVQEIFPEWVKEEDPGYFRTAACTGGSHHGTATTH